MCKKRIVSQGKTCEYPYPVCKKRIVSQGKTHEYPYPVCKKRIVSQDQTSGYPYPVCKKKKLTLVKLADTLIYFYNTLPQLQIKLGCENSSEEIFIFLNENLEFRWLEHLWNHKNMFELMSVNHSTRSGGIIGISSQFTLTSRYVSCSHWTCLIEVILMSTHNIPFSI